MVSRDNHDGALAVPWGEPRCGDGASLEADPWVARLCALPTPSLKTKIVNRDDVIANPQLLPHAALLRRLAPVGAMSALPPKADINRRDPHVR
jgi:hypothetical protein